MCLSEFVQLCTTSHISNMMRPFSRNKNKTLCVVVFLGVNRYIYAYNYSKLWRNNSDDTLEIHSKVLEKARGVIKMFVDCLYEIKKTL